MEYSQFLLNYGGAIIAAGVALWSGYKGRKASKALEADKAKYAKELAAQQAEYTKELAKQQKEYTAQIETLRNQLAFELARKTKFAEKEFKVLAECWKRMGNLHLAAIQVESHGIGNYRLTYTEGSFISKLSDFTSERCKTVLRNNEELSAEDREFIAQEEPAERPLEFSSSVLKYYRNKYMVSLDSFASYFSDNRIFLNLALQAEFQNVWLACGAVEAKASEIAEAGSDREAVQASLEKINADLPPLIEAMQTRFWNLERLVAGQLYPEEAAAMKKEQAASGGES